ncbi:hypothetical protein SCACP_38540 [Sporomusa carbonis]|uniref:restriction endonuclease subunit S n=1 Tax=Sporomusa carbonis TaxID=3076075 RepID=UPI003A6CFC00
MKDSGVEWLGEVPEHWDVVPLLKKISSIVDYRGRTPQKVEDGIFLLTARNIGKGKIDYECAQEYTTEADYREIVKRGKPVVGHVVFTTEAPLGHVANLDRDDIAIAQRVIKFDGLAKTLDNTFLKYFILSSFFQAQLYSYATGSTALGIKVEKLVYLRLVLPPYSEQQIIVRYLEEQVRNITRIIDAVRSSIDILRERRSALITAAVTGQIDVREAAIE